MFAGASGSGRDFTHAELAGIASRAGRDSDSGLRVCPDLLDDSGHILSLRIQG